MEELTTPSLFGTFPLRRIALVVAALTCLLYWRVLQFEFVTYDDYDLIHENEQFIAHPANVFAAFATNAFTGHRTEGFYYRPVLLAMFVGEYQLWGLHPAGYHAVNLLLHALTAALVVLLLGRLGLSTAAAALGGLLFALHPVQTESVAWIAGGNDVLLGLFIVLSAYAFVRYRQSGGRRRWIALSLAWYAAALFTKESALFYVLLLPLIGWSVPVAPGARIWSKTILTFLFLVLIAGFLAARTAAIGAFIGTEQLYEDSSLLQRILLSPAMVVQHLSFLFVPARLSVVHPASEAFWLQGGWKILAAVIALVLLAGVIWGWKRNRIFLLGLGWVIVGMLPALNVIPVAVPILEHRLYLPMAGFAMLVVEGVLVVTKRREAVAAGVLLCAVLVCGVLTFERYPVWRNSETLWNDAIEKYPSYSRSYFNLAGYYYEQREYDKAMGLMQTYIRLRPEDAMGYVKLRQVYYAAARYADAASVTRRMIATSPNNPDRYAEAAELFMAANLPDSAIAVYREGIAILPNAYYLHDLLGRVFVRLQADSLAMPEYEAAIDQNPRFAPAYFDLGALYASHERSREAVALIEKGMQYGAVPHDILQLLHQLYIESGDTDKAESLRKQFPY